MEGALNVVFLDIVVIVPVNVANPHDGPPGQFGVAGHHGGKPPRGFGDNLKRADDGVKGLPVALELFQRKPGNELLRVLSVAGDIEQRQRPSIETKRALANAFTKAAAESCRGRRLQAITPHVIIRS